MGKFEKELRTRLNALSIEEVANEMHQRGLSIKPRASKSWMINEIYSYEAFQRLQ